MSRCSLPILILALFGAPLLTAKDDKKKEAPDTSSVDVRFTDGSTVRMQILQESIEVQTKYGKLTVPTNEIRRIEFAFRIPEETTRKVEAAVKDLGHVDHARREAASKELMAIGAPALPALQVVTKSLDLEVARRAQSAIQAIKEKVPAEELRFPTSDTIHTAEFPINGKILTTSIKARNVYFGPVQLEIINMRQMRWTVQAGEALVTVDAARYAQPNQWMETDISVGGLGGVVLTAAGQVDLWPQTPGQYMTGPSGYPPGGRQGQHLGGTLLGKIGEGGKVFFVGERYEGTPGEDGKLYLHIVPSPWNNPSSGAYTVKIVSR